MEGLEQGHDKQQHYRIEIQGELDERWAELFDGMDIAYQDGLTTLTGCVRDQVTLRGILNGIWDLNLVLISVQRVERTEGI